MYTVLRKLARSNHPPTTTVPSQLISKQPTALSGKFVTSSEECFITLLSSKLNDRSNELAVAGSSTSLPDVINIFVPNRI